MRLANITGLSGAERARLADYMNDKQVRATYYVVDKSGTVHGTFPRERDAVACQCADYANRQLIVEYK